jgi:F0F1-type ATP synthase assembly protein I
VDQGKKDNENDYKERKNTKSSAKPTTDRQRNSAEFVQSKKGGKFSATRLKAEFLSL